MALEAGMSSDDDKTGKPDHDKPDQGKPDQGKLDHDTASGTSLTPAAGGAAGIDPFLASADETPKDAEARPLWSRMLDYSAHAAMIVGLIGFAWTVSDHVVNRQTKAKVETPTMLADATSVKPVKPEPPKIDEMGELRHANQKMAAELRGLHASLEALRNTVARNHAPEDMRDVTASIDSLKSGLASAKSEMSTALAQLNGKIDKVQRDARPQQVAERPVKPERQAVDTTSTGSIPPSEASSPRPVAAKAVPTPPSKPTELASAEDDTAKPPVIAGWVVRDVYDGVALVEGRRGASMEVVPGVTIPGAGVVKSIERHGAGWTVTTSKGQLAYAAPPRDPHRGGYYGRDYYPRRYDF